MLLRLTLVAVALVGCTTGFSWSLPPGGTDQQLRVDKYDCAKAAVDPNKVGSYTEKVYILCMEAKGYRRGLW